MQLTFHWTFCPGWAIRHAGAKIETVEMEIVHIFLRRDVGGNGTSMLVHVTLDEIF